MYETGLSFSIYLVNSIVGSIYMQKFLREKYQKKIVLSAWAGLYFIIQSLIFDRIDRLNLFNNLMGVLADIAFILLFQMLLYNKDFLKQLFVAVSFVAGKEIIKYIIVVINYGQNWAVSKFSVVLLQRIAAMEEVEIWSCISSVAMGLVSLLSYTLLLTAYSSIISRKFVRKDYQFRIHEYTFLLLPSAAALCISITLKVLIFIVENGTITIMFEKVPTTMFWVPFICFLLLGVILPSVMLFQKLIQLGEEERKRSMGWRELKEERDERIKEKREQEEKEKKLKEKNEERQEHLDRIKDGSYYPKFDMNI